MKELIADAYVYPMSYSPFLTHPSFREEEDEETVEWEQEQLRRGGHRTPEPSSVEAKQVYKPAPSEYSYIRLKTFNILTLSQFPPPRLFPC